MTTQTPSSSLRAMELKELARTLNRQLSDLYASVGEVRRLLYEEARLQKKARKSAPRKEVRSIAPVTIFHGKGGPTSVKGHECLEPPVTQPPSAGARE